jgi:hypothetical protein
MQSRPAFLIPLPIILALLVLVSLLVSVPAFPATFVVDPSGNDADPGDSTAPWRTIQHAATVASAGDTVVIRAGRYSESVSLLSSGAAGNPIVFTADPGAVLVSPNPTASMEAFNVAPGVGFITLSGIEATGGYAETIFLRSGAHDIQIDGCNLHDDRAGIIMADAFNVTVDNCALHNNSHLGMRLVGTTHDVLVSDTASFANGKPSMCSAKVDGFASSSGVSNVTFLRTRAYNNGGDGFDLKGAQTIFDQVSSFGNACTGLKIWQSASVNGCLVAQNGGVGVAMGSVSGGSTVDITNCTVAANRSVQINLHGPSNPGTVFAVNLLNNIVAGDFKAVQYGSTVALSESHNIFYRPNAYTIVLSPSSGHRFSGHDVNVGLWNQVSGKGEGTLAVDPQFVDSAHGDFHVSPNSAAVGRGQSQSGPVNIGMYQDPAGPANHTPWADAGRSPTGRTNRAVLFSAAGSVDPDGDALTYSWDFGDGTAPVLGFQVLHAFSAPKTYSVTLTVSDGSLSNTKTIQAFIH